MNATGTNPQPAPEQQSRRVPGRLLPLVLLCGVLVVSPLFLSARSTTGLAILAIALFLPYLVVCWRLVRTPGTKDGPGLAAGIAVIFAVVAAVGCALTIEEGSYLKLGYFAALGLLHALMAGFGYIAFRHGTSMKPGWRVAVRSFIDPLVYYGIVFLLALGALAHH
jgi:hypothetical protein